MRFSRKVFVLHYEGEGEGGEGGEGGGGEGGQGGEGKVMTQAEIDAIVTKRTEQARQAQRRALTQLEEMQTKLKMNDEERAKFEEELTSLRSKTLSAEEIAKREKKKADETYQTQLTQLQTQAQTWEQRHNTLKVNHEISQSALRHGVLGSAVPMLESFLSSRVKVEPVKDEADQISGFTTIVNFEDQSGDGKPIQTTLSIDETVKRMKELPDIYGYLFASNNQGGIGGNSGQGSGKNTKGYRPGMTTAEYAQLRREDPSAVYSD